MCSCNNDIPFGRDFDRYNNIIGVIENCVFDITEICNIENNEENFHIFQELCFRLSVFAHEMRNI